MRRMVISRGRGRGTIPRRRLPLRPARTYRSSPPIPVLQAAAASRSKQNPSPRPLVVSEKRATPDKVLNPNCAQKVCFIDLAFHNRTSSTWFVPELLSERYRVECYYDDYGLQRSPRGVQLASFERVVVFQLDPTRLVHPNITWIPMWDEFAIFPRTPRSVRKVVSFSSALHRAVQTRGLRSRWFQYWPEVPATIERKSLDPVVLFWSRKPSEVSWAQVRALTSTVPSAKYHVKDVPDPGERHAVISSTDLKNRVTVHGWDPSRDGYSKLLCSSNIFISPRHREGIGMSFLEAMAHGLCVVAKNQATVNEYIRHGQNGLLYDDVKPLKLDRFHELGEAAFQSAMEGRRRWIELRPALLNYISE